MVPAALLLTLGLASARAEEPAAEEPVAEEPAAEEPAAIGLDPALQIALQRPLKNHRTGVIVGATGVGTAVIAGGALAVVMVDLVGNDGITGVWYPATWVMVSGLLATGICLPLGTAMAVSGDARITGMLEDAGVDTGRRGDKVALGLVAGAGGMVVGGWAVSRAYRASDYSLAWAEGAAPLMVATGGALFLGAGVVSYGHQRRLRKAGTLGPTVLADADGQPVPGVRVALGW